MYVSAPQNTIGWFQINNIPLPENISEVSNKVDFNKNKHYDYIKDTAHGIATLDPFFTARMMEDIPDYQFRQFVTPLHPREIYLYIKKEFYNKIIGNKGLSVSHFDVENEGNSMEFIANPNKDDIYYSLEISGLGQNRKANHFAIAIFKLASMKRTTVYVFSW